jgi:hypothetical protein
MKQSHRIIYICGSGHSGSTLLDLILGSHSQVVSLGEIGQFSRFFRDNDLCTCGAPAQRCEFWRNVQQTLLSSFGYDLFAPPQDHIVSFLPGHKQLQKQPNWIRQKFSYDSLSAIGLLGSLSLLHFGLKLAPSISQGLAYNIALFDAVIQSSQVQYVVDSSKSWFRMKLLYLWKPELMKIIFLVRDGRGVVYSHIRKENLSIEEAARSWARTQKANLWMLRSIPAESWRLVRYEDLTSEPDSTLLNLCNWLGLSYEPEMLRFRQTKHHNLAGNRMRFGSEEKIINAAHWRSELKAEDLDAFNCIAGKLNKYFGYKE